MLALNLTATAEQELHDIYTYSLEKWGEKKADEYLKQLENSFYLLLNNPQLGKQRNELKHGYRSLLVQKHSIFYNINDNEINILRILHMRMDVKNILKPSILKN